MGPTTGARCLGVSLCGRQGLGLDGRLSGGLACQPGDFDSHAHVPRVGAKQPNVEAPTVGVPLDSAGPAAHHSPARHLCDALLHLRQPRRGARPPTLGSARPHVGLDCCGRGRAGACSSSAASPRLERHVVRQTFNYPRISAKKYFHFYSISAPLSATGGGQVLHLKEQPLSLFNPVFRYTSNPVSHTILIPVFNNIPTPVYNTMPTPTLYTISITVLHTTSTHLKGQFCILFLLLFLFLSWFCF